MRLKAACEKGCRGNMTLEWNLIIDDGVRRYEPIGWEAKATGMVFS